MPENLMLRRRRRTMRVAGTLVFLAFVLGLMAYSGKGGSGGGGKKAAATENLPCPEVEAAEPSAPTFDAPPDVGLRDGVDYSAVITTSCGDIEVDLLEESPQTIANFMYLAEQGFYDGLPWHRIERDFVIQTGDPDGVPATDSEGPGYTIPDELPPEDTKYFYGDVAMANNGPDTGGSQFFIVVHDQETKKDDAGIQPDYALFGRVLESSYETLDKIARMPVTGGDDINTAVMPTSPVIIESIEVRTG